MEKEKIQENIDEGKEVARKEGKQLLLDYLAGEYVDENGAMRFWWCGVCGSECNEIFHALEKWFDIEEWDDAERRQEERTRQRALPCARCGHENS